MYIRLNKDINPKYLLQKIQQTINDHSKSNSLEDSVLCIEIKTIERIIDDTIIKLENTLEKLNND